MSGLFGIGGDVEKKVNEIQSTSDKLAAALGASDKANMQSLAPFFVSAAVETTPDDIGLYDWSTVIAAICWRETRGKSIVGDYGARWRYGPPSYAVELELLTGKSKPGKKGTLFEVAPPAYNDAPKRGWGYGYMQIDFESHRDWLDENDWRDANANITKGAVILSESYEHRAISSLSQAIAAYNAGVSAVSNTENPDSVTTGGDYSSDVLANAFELGLSEELIA